MRDLRDPQKLGERYLQLRKGGIDIEFAVDVPAQTYQSGPWISAPPSDHHLAEHPDVHLLSSGIDISDGAE